MPTRHKGKVHDLPLEDFTKDDPDDSDFDVSHSAPRARPTRIKSRSKKPKHKSSHPKPPRRNRDYDSSSVVSDGDSIESDEPFTEDEASDDPPDTNPRTGRPTRRITKRKTANYAESDSNDESDDDDDDDVDDIDELQASPTKRLHLKAEHLDEDEPKQSLIVTLSVPPEKLRAIMQTRLSRRLRTRSISQSAPAHHQTRRSGRHSEEPEPLLELSNSGMPRYATGGKSTAKTASKAPARTGSKAPAKTVVNVPSVLIEESQESASIAPPKDADDSDGEPQNDITVLVESIETPGDPHDAEQHSDDEEKAASEKADEADDDDDDEDGPVRRPSRAMARKVRRTPSLESMLTHPE
jgi:hypothetical protein